MVKKRGMVIVVMLLCCTVSAVSAWGTVNLAQSVSLEENYPGAGGSIAADPAYAGVVSYQDPMVPEFPTIAAPLGMIIGLLGILFALRNRYFSFHRESVNKR